MIKRLLNTIELQRQRILDLEVEKHQLQQALDGEYVDGLIEELQDMINEYPGELVRPLIVSVAEH
jgi:hypothetical protein